MTVAGTDTQDIRLDPIEEAVADIAVGRPVVVVDDENRENEGDLIFAASKATPELLAFMIRHTSGVICVPMLGADLDRLNLPPMTEVNECRLGTAFTISVDAASGISTGISAADRSHTIQRLADPATQAHDLVRPGHLFPLRAVDGGVLTRRGHTEAALDLTRLAGLPPVGVLCELTLDNGAMMRLPHCHEFARKHKIKLISIEDLSTYRRDHQAALASSGATA